MTADYNMCFYILQWRFWRSYYDISCIIFLLLHSLSFSVELLRYFPLLNINTVVDVLCLTGFLKFTLLQLLIYMCIQAHPISQPTSNYIKLSSCLTIYLLGEPWLSFFSVFVITSCDIEHNGDGICKILSAVFCFPVNLWF